jgi:hypothetical protein
VPRPPWNALTLSESQTTSNRGTSAYDVSIHALQQGSQSPEQLTRSNRRVERINIEGEVRGPVPAGVDIVQRHVHDLSDAVLVDLVHGEALDVVLPEYRLLGGIQVAQANVHAGHISLRLALT